MKKLYVFLMLAICVTAGSRALGQVSINVNIGSQPLWGPVGYDHVDYYYLPDIESYYYVPTRKFIYLNNGRWIFSSGLPSAYRNYDLYNGYKVVINSPKPYLNYTEHKVKYSKYKSNRSQAVILRSNDPKYYVVKGHPKSKAKVSVKGGPSGKVKVNPGHKAHGNGHAGGNDKGRGKH
ncbi:hypothetical protein [Arcticibacter tournemirensis]